MAEDDDKSDISVNETAAPLVILATIGKYIEFAMAAREEAEILSARLHTAYLNEAEQRTLKMPEANEKRNVSKANKARSCLPIHIHSRLAEITSSNLGIVLEVVNSQTLIVASCDSTIPDESLPDSSKTGWEFIHGPKSGTPSK